MRRPSCLCSLAALALFVAATAITAQTALQPAPPPVFIPVAALPFDTAGPVLRAPAQPQKPFTVAGPRGVLIGQQDGSLEAWVLPVKLLSSLTIEALVDGYPTPVNVNRQAAQVEVRPDRTIVTYSNVGFTVRQIMFSPDAAPQPGLATTGPVILYEFDCLHPTDFTFRFEPEVRWMWPARSEGIPDAGWISPDPHNAFAPGGFYDLQTDFPDLAAAITIPGATPGLFASSLDHPKEHPVELKLHIDPVRDHGRLFPLLMAVGTTPATASERALGLTLAHLNEQIPALYDAQSKTYKDLLAHSVSIETPDKSLDEAFQWAVVSIEQLKTPITPAAAVPGDKPEQIGLVAGYVTSADSARPGFGWYFGRDSLFTLYATNGYGDFALTRDELEFLIHRQRADGKIMHEYSQTAAAVDWQQFPFEYAAADSTPLFLMAFADYLRATGDTAFLAAHRDAIEKAWAFETDPAHDTDHDGIYDNSQGTGWVESWPGGMPHQEIYLALLDQQASSAMAAIERALNDSSKAESAERRADAVAKTINAEYYDPQKSCYAFSRDILKDGSPTLDRTATVYPSLAWWDPANGKSILDHPDACLRQFVASAINTDWGTRDVANNEPIYDGMSYHQGSVWPLFTGWAALAEYRANQPLAGYQLLKENADLTWAHDLGSDTELLSGDFFYPMGTSHQMWSSAMVITPTLRGLFGISIDAQTKTITVNPHLPASWDHAAVKNIPIGAGTADLAFEQAHGVLNVTLHSAASGYKLATTAPGAKTLSASSLAIPQHPVAVGAFFSAPRPGERTQATRVLDETYADRKLTLTLEGPAGTDAQLPLALSVPEPKLHVTGADLAPSTSAPSLIAHFPAGQGFQTITITLTW